MILQKKVKKDLPTEEERRERFGRRSAVRVTRWFVEVQTITGYVVHFPDPDFAALYLVPEVDNDRLGAAVLLALSQSRFLSREEALDPRNSIKANAAQYEGNTLALMRRFNIPSRRAFANGMMSCPAEMRAGTITFTSTRQEGMDASLVLPDAFKAEVRADAGAEAVGAALRLALSHCLAS